jgi:shikimate kinase
MWITLIGFHAAGKTTVAKRLAPATDRRAVDLDAQVARSLGVPLDDVRAAAGGDPAWDRAGELLADMDAGAPLVLAAGAAVVERPDLMDLLRRRGPVVWLDAPWPVLRARLAPALGAEPWPLWPRLGEPALAAAYARRRPLYAAAARLRLDTGRPAPAAVVRRLLGRIMQLPPAPVEDRA